MLAASANAWTLGLVWTPAAPAATVSALISAHLPPTADAYTAAIATVAGSTGQLLLIVMLLMYTAALETMRVRGPRAPERASVPVPGACPAALTL